MILFTKSLLGIALAATITGGASVATHQALQSSSETEVQNHEVSVSAGSQANVESDFDANFMSSSGINVQID